MAKTLGQLLLLWFSIGFAYIILAACCPAIYSLSDQGAALTLATGTGNYTRWPAEFMIIVGKLLIWFIPGGLGILATIVLLKNNPGGNNE